MDNYGILTVLREMAWERAKGELISMLETFYDDENEYDRLKLNFDKFIKAIEDGYELELKE